MTVFICKHGKRINTELSLSEPPACIECAADAVCEAMEQQTESFVRQCGNKLTSALLNATMSSTGTVITIECSDHETKDIILGKLIGDAERD